MKSKQIIFKNLIAILLLGVCFIISILVIEKALSPNNSTFSGFYEEPKDTIDVAFVGGSHGMAAFSPAQIWQENQITSYNIYSWSQNPWTAYHYAVEAIREQDIKVLVVEAFSFSYGQSYLPAQTSDETSNEFALSIPPSLNRLFLSLAIRENQVVPLPISKMIPVIRYHSRWDDIEFSELYDNLFVSNYSSNKGFGPIFTTEVFDNVDYLDIGTNTQLEASSKEYLLKLIDLCNKEGIQLILAKTPYIPNPEDRGYLDEIKAICDENNIPFLNYMSEDLLNETGFSYSSDMAEHAHINYLGAKKLSSHIGDFIKENYLPNQEYSSETIKRWDTESAIEERDIDTWDLKLSPSFNILAQTLKEKENYTAIITAHGDLTKADTSTIENALTTLGIDTDILSSTSASEIYIILDDEIISSKDFYLDDKLEVSVSNDTSSITYNGIEQSRNREGFNVVIFDEITNEIVHSVSFAIEHNYEYYTA